MSFNVGPQGNFTLTITGFDADKNEEPFSFEVDRLDYPTVTKAMTNCPILASKLNPELMTEILEKTPAKERQVILDKIEGLQEAEQQLIIKLLSNYFPPERRKILNYMLFDELVNMFYFLATGNEEIKSLTDIMNELEAVQENYKKKAGLNKKPKKKA